MGVDVTGGSLLGRGDTECEDCEMRVRLGELERVGRSSVAGGQQTLGEGSDLRRSPAG